MEKMSLVGQEIVKRHRKGADVEISIEWDLEKEVGGDYGVLCRMVK